MMRGEGLSLFELLVDGEKIDVSVEGGSVHAVPGFFEFAAGRDVACPSISVCDQLKECS